MGWIGLGLQAVDETPGKYVDPEIAPAVALDHMALLLVLAVGRPDRPSRRWTVTHFQGLAARGVRPPG